MVRKISYSITIFVKFKFQNLLTSYICWNFEKQCQKIKKTGTVWKKSEQRLY